VLASFYAASHGQGHAHVGGGADAACMHMGLGSQQRAVRLAHACCSSLTLLATPPLPKRPCRTDFTATRAVTLFNRFFARCSFYANDRWVSVCGRPRLTHTGP